MSVTTAKGAWYALHCLAVRWLAVMSPERVDLITRSFDELWPLRRNLAATFYTRFFENAPDAQRLFPADMEKQYLKLMDTIAAIVGGLKDRSLFQSVISHAARQHARFGVTASQLAAFGDALIWGLEQHFGSAFTPEMRQAWIELYEDVQAQMIRHCES